MLKLCGFHLSNYHNKVRIALLEKGVPFEEDPTCTPSQKDEFVARSPMGKVPFLELDGGRRLAESEVIVEYLEDAYPQKPLLPKDPFERAKVRELVTVTELHLELPARRLYGHVFFKRPASEEVIRAVEKDLPNGVRALTTKLAYGRDILEDLAPLKPYLKMLGERPAFARVNEDRKAAQAALSKK